MKLIVFAYLSVAYTLSYEHILKFDDILYYNQDPVRLGLPWWHSGRESACQYRGHGFEPWSGKIPHAVEQLGP